jgi:holin-like protein
MLRTFATLLVFQCVGEVLARGLSLPVPGPVLGMVLMAGYLLAVPASAEALRPTALELLRHLSLLFVPAGVGVVQHGQRLADEGTALAVALVVSTAAAIAATALTIQWATRRFAPDDDGSAPR